MNRDAIFACWKCGAPIQQLAKLMDSSVAAIEETIRMELLSREAKRRRRPIAPRKRKRPQRNAEVRP